MTDKQPENSDFLGEEHMMRRELSGRLGQLWHDFTHKYGANETVWMNRTKEDLEEMKVKVSGWIEECVKEITARPSPEGKDAKDSSIDNWKNSLGQKLTQIEEIIATKG